MKLGKPEKRMSCLDGIVLATGSIIGSGVLFLPSFTFSLARSDVLVAWVTAALFCVPLLIIISSLVTASSSARGIEEIVSAELGSSIGASIPLLFLGSVCIGIPASATIVGKYSQNHLNFLGLGYYVAYLVILVAILSNTFGKQLGTRINLVVAFGFLTVGAALIAMTLPPSIESLRVMSPTFSIRAILSGSAAAFWAFAGFENLAFSAREFKRPKPDFFISVSTALLICSVLYILLTANFSAWIGNTPIQMATGLTQLSETANLSWHVGPVIAIFAILAVQANLISWVWGMSRLVSSSARRGYLPAFFGKHSNQDIPVRAIAGLGITFLSVTVLVSIWPDILDTCFMLVSGNFIFIYILCLASYLKSSGTRWKKALAATCLIYLSIMLICMESLVFYPFSLFLLGILVNRAQNLGPTLKRQ
jgi:amino acid efflux transporter